MRQHWPLGMALLALLAACAGPSTSTAAPPTAPATAGSEPSVSARMVCEPEAQKDISTLLGVDPVRVEPPSWSDHVYSCRYVYADGAFVMSVKELASAVETTDYFDGLGTRLGRDHDLDGLGQGAFVTSNGSVVVRKDTKVLLVDDAALPVRFGRPPVAAADAAQLVADAIMGCWSGI